MSLICSEAGPSNLIIINMDVITAIPLGNVGYYKMFVEKGKIAEKDGYTFEIWGRNGYTPIFVTKGKTPDRLASILAQLGLKWVED